MRPHTVLVCAAHADIAEGDRYVMALQARGLDVWYDRTGLQFGSLIIETVEQQLRQRTAMVVLFSQASVTSHWVKMQMGAFLALMEEGDNSRLLLPVRIGPCEMPLLLRAGPWIDAVNYPFEDVTHELAQALGGALHPVQQKAAASIAKTTNRDVSSADGSQQMVQDRRTHVFAIANQKGRVGKTVSAINLAACLADAGHKTLLVDLSPEGDVTTGLGVDARHVSGSVYEMLVQGMPVTEVIKSTESRPNLSLLPATGGDLYAAETELVYLEQREFRLKHALAPIKQSFDFVLIDCPSWLGHLTINGLTASDGVMMPLQCEYFALEGMQQLLNTIRLVHDRLNPAIRLFGVILTMFDPRTKLGSEVVREISEHFPKERFQTVIPRAMRLAEASSFGQTILEHDPRSPGALAYTQLADEVVARAAAMSITEEQPAERVASVEPAKKRDTPSRYPDFPTPSPHIPFADR